MVLSSSCTSLSVNDDTSNHRSISDDGEGKEMQDSSHNKNVNDKNGKVTGTSRRKKLNSSYKSPEIAHAINNTIIAFKAIEKMKMLASLTKKQLNKKSDQILILHDHDKFYKSLGLEEIEEFRFMEDKMNDNVNRGIRNSSDNTLPHKLATKSQKDHRRIKVMSKKNGSKPNGKTDENNNSSRSHKSNKKIRHETEDGKNRKDILSCTTNVRQPKHSKYLKKGIESDEKIKKETLQCLNGEGDGRNVTSGKPTTPDSTKTASSPMIPSKLYSRKSRNLLTSVATTSGLVSGTELPFSSLVPEITWKRNLSKNTASKTHVCSAETKKLNQKNLASLSDDTNKEENQQKYRQRVKKEIITPELAIAARTTVKTSKKNKFLTAKINKPMPPPRNFDIQKKESPEKRKTPKAAILHNTVSVDDHKGTDFCQSRTQSTQQELGEKTPTRCLSNYISSLTPEQFDDAVFDEISWLNNGNHGANAIYTAIDAGPKLLDKKIQIILEAFDVLAYKMFLYSSNKKKLESFANTIDDYVLISLRRLASNLPQLPMMKESKSCSYRVMQKSVKDSLEFLMEFQMPDYTKKIVDDDVVEALCKIRGLNMLQYFEWSYNVRKKMIDDAVNALLDNKKINNALDELMENNFEIEKIQDKSIFHLVHLIGVLPPKKIRKSKQTIAGVLLQCKSDEKKKRRDKLLKEIFNWLRSIKTRVDGITDGGLFIITNAAGLILPRGLLKDGSTRVIIVRETVDWFRYRKIPLDHIDQSNLDTLWKIIETVTPVIPKIVATPAKLLTSNEKITTVEKAISSIRRHPIRRRNNIYYKPSNCHYNDTIETENSMLLPSNFTHDIDLDNVIYWLKHNDNMRSDNNEDMEGQNEAFIDISLIIDRKESLLSSPLKKQNQEIRFRSMKAALECLRQYFDHSLDYEANHKMFMQKIMFTGMPFPPGSMEDKARILEDALYWFMNPTPHSHI